MSNEKSPRRGRGPSTRVTEQAFAATFKLLQQSGFSSLSMEAIADSAGVNKTTLYRRWGSLNSLLKEAIASQDIGKPDMADTGSLQSDIRELANQFAFYFCKPEIIAIIRLIASSRDHSLEELMNEYWLERADLFTALIERASARGETVRAHRFQMAIEIMVGPMLLRLLMTHQPIDSDLLDTTSNLAYQLLTT